MTCSRFAIAALVLALGVATPPSTSFAQSALGAARGGSRGGSGGHSGGSGGHSGGSAGGAARGGFRAGGGGSSSGGGGGFRLFRRHQHGYGGYGYYPYYGAGAVGAVAAPGQPLPLTPTYFRMTFAGGYGRWAEPSPDGGLVVTGATADLGLSVGSVVSPRVALHFDADFGVLFGSRGQLAGAGFRDYSGILTHSLLGGGVTVNPRTQGFYFTAAVGTGRTRVSTDAGTGRSRFGFAGYLGLGYLAGTRPASNLRFSVLARVFYLNAPDETRVSNFAPQLAFGISR